MNSKEQGIVGLALGGRLGLRRKVSIAAFAAVSMIGGAASAQTITISATQPLIRDPARSLPNDFRWDITRQDCVDDSLFKFAFTFNAWTTMQTFEVWGSTQAADCKDESIRNNTNNSATPPCIKLACTDCPTQGNAGGEASLTVSEMLKLVNLDSDSVQNCGQDIGTHAPIKMNLYFMLMDGNNTDVSVAEFPGTSGTMRIDLWGPAATGELNATAGDGSISVNPKPPEGDLTDGFVIYCAQNGKVVSPSGSESSSDSGCAWSVDATGITGGAGGGGGTTSSSGGSGGTGGSGGAGGSSGDSGCPTTLFVEGQAPDTEWVPCASGSTVEGLENGAPISIAVAYKDNLGNVGALSAPVCITPEPMDDFFEHYNRSGGKGGGGFCSISHRSRKATSFGVSFALAALALAYRRRARQNRNAASKEVSQ